MIDDVPDMTAAELALGVLDGAERAAALRRMLAEPAFAAEVQEWRETFGPLFDAVPVGAPGPALFARIEHSLDGAPTTVPSRRQWLWPSLAGASSVAAALLLAILLTQPAPPRRPPAVSGPGYPAPLLAAAIIPTAGRPDTSAGAPISAIYDRAGTLRLSSADLAGNTRSAELWVIGADGVPHSLGLLQRAHGTMLRIGTVNRVRLTPSAVLAVSIEPLGGSPTGLPTGPVVAKGTLALT